MRGECHLHGKFETVEATAEPSGVTNGPDVSINPETDENAELNVRETAELLGVSENTVRNWAEGGMLPVARRLPSGFRRFDRAAVQKMRDEMWQSFETREPLLGDEPGQVSADAVSQMVDALNAVWPDARAEEDHASMLHLLAEAAVRAAAPDENRVTVDLSHLSKTDLEWFVNNPGSTAASKRIREAVAAALSDGRKK